MPSDRYIGAENIEAALVPTIADFSAPTLVELGAAVFISGFVPDGGIDIPESGNVADTSDITWKRDTNIDGTYGGDLITMELYRGLTTDTAWDMLIRGSLHYLAYADKAIATPSRPGPAAFTAGDIVSLFEIRVVTRSRIRTPRKEANRFVATCAVADVLEDYTVPA